MTMRGIVRDAGKSALRTAGLALAIGAVLIGLIAIALVDDSCPSGLSGPAALPWLQDMRQQMCGSTAR